MNPDTHLSLLERINKSIDKLRPYLQSDGGDVIVDGVSEDMIVKVRLIGACGACPFSLFTLKAGIEQALQKDIPEIKEVIAI